MWIYTTDALLSIVAHREQPECLLVRARFTGDLERAFPGADVTETPDADYRFRATIPRADVGAFLLTAAMDIWYTNFKGKLSADTEVEALRADAYHEAHRAAVDAQEQAKRAENPPRRKAGR
jgi:hypothetical protein